MAVKHESFNPLVSVKDRIGVTMIVTAIGDRILRGDKVIFLPAIAGG